MSIENEIAKLTAAIIEHTAVLRATQTMAPVAATPVPAAAAVVAHAVPAPTITPTPAPTAQVPIVQPAVSIATPAPVAAVQQNTVMPAPPSFAAPVPMVPSSAAPFKDGKGLIDYVMKTYQELGAQKGAQIQQVLTGLGYTNINDCKPEHYDALFAGVEALKVSS